MINLNKFTIQKRFAISVSAKSSNIHTGVNDSTIQGNKC